jgi:hypothetical protein
VYSENQDVLYNYETTGSITLTKTSDTDIDNDDTQCLPCNEGYSCSLGSSPTACLAGTYSNVAVPYCEVCPPGHYCEDKAANPTPCPINTYNPDVGGVDVSSCSAVPATGMYAPLGSDTYWPCPGGYECSTGIPIICPMGQYSTEGELDCNACLQGYTCPAGSSIKTPPGGLCPKGSYCETSGGFTLETK